MTNTDFVTTVWNALSIVVYQSYEKIFDAVNLSRIESYSFYQKKAFLVCWGCQLLAVGLIE